MYTLAHAKQTFSEDKRRLPHRLEFFLYDFGTQPSALSPGIIKQQTDYVARTIPDVIKQRQARNESNRGIRVVLIGHSMGSIVAYNALSKMDESMHHYITVVLSIAGPMTMSPMYFNKEMEEVARMK